MGSSSGHDAGPRPTFRLDQEPLAAKRDFALPRALAKLDAFDLLILDDIGYVQQVLFTLMAERYERRQSARAAATSRTR